LLLRLYSLLELVELLLEPLEDGRSVDCQGEAVAVRPPFEPGGYVIGIVAPPALGRTELARMLNRITHQQLYGLGFTEAHLSAIVGGFGHMRDVGKPERYAVEFLLFGRHISVVGLFQSLGVGLVIAV